MNCDCCHYHTVPAPVVVSWSPEGVACVGIPVEMSSGPDYSSLEVLWPETPHTPHKLCYCPPFEGDQHLFSRCINTSSCDTHYSVTVNSVSVCFAGLQHELTIIPVYFTLLQPCGGGRCIIRSLLAGSIQHCPRQVYNDSYCTQSQVALFIIAPSQVVTCSSGCFSVWVVLALCPGPKIGSGTYCVCMVESTGQKLAKASKHSLGGGKKHRTKGLQSLSGVAEARESFVSASRLPRERKVTESTDLSTS